MPNWCTNEVTIVGEPDEVARFRDVVGDDFDFNALIPMPELIRNTGSGSQVFQIDGEDVKLNSWYEGRDTSEMRPFTDAEMAQLAALGATNWYDWALSRWGCKWPASDVSCEEWGKNSLTYTFDTPWGPPEGIHAAVIAQFPELEVSWHWREPGMEGSGYL